MEVKLEIVEPKTSYSCTMFAQPDKELLRKTKTIIVRSFFVSKTRVDTSMQIGEAKNGINFEVQDYRSDKVEDFSYLDGAWHVYHYFKKLKSQGFEEYKEYVKKAVKIAVEEYLLIKDIDVLTIKLVKCKDW
jgi:hypothetical protein